VKNAPSVAPTEPAIRTTEERHRSQHRAPQHPMCVRVLSQPTHDPPEKWPETRA